MIWLEANNSKFTLRCINKLKCWDLIEQRKTYNIYSTKQKCWVWVWQRTRRKFSFVRSTHTHTWWTVRQDRRRGGSIFIIRSQICRVMLCGPEPLNGIWRHCKTGSGIPTFVHLLQSGPEYLSLNLPGLTFLAGLVVINIPRATRNGGQLCGFLICDWITNIPSYFSQHA